MTDKNTEECLKDLYLLGLIQGEHNINWTDEYNLLKHSKNYYHKIKTIADKYSIRCNKTLMDYCEDEDENEYMLWDRWAFDLHEMTKDHILKALSKNIS